MPIRAGGRLSYEVMVILPEAAMGASRDAESNVMTWLVGASPLLPELAGGRWRWGRGLVTEPVVPSRRPTWPCCAPRSSSWSPSGPVVAPTIIDAALMLGHLQPA